MLDSSTAAGACSGMFLTAAMSHDSVMSPHSVMFSTTFREPIMRVTLVALVTLSLLGCGGDSKPAQDASDVDASDSSSASGDEGGGEGDGAAAGDAGTEEEVAERSAIPTSCASHEGEICLPSKGFARKMCQGDYSGVALKLFSNGTPWTRGYLTHETDAWNASGGGSSKERLALDEEVLVMYFRKANSNEGGIQVSGANGGYDAMRWDGMCVTLDASELRFDPPAKPRNAHLVWSRIEFATRKVLKKDETVRQAYIARKKECKGVTVGTVTKKCEKLDKELSKVIANFVRESGDSLPMPKKMPE